MDKNEFSLISRTLSAHWFCLIGTLGSYTPRKLWKLEKFRLILIIFEVYATGNTAQLGFCGVGYMNWAKSSQQLHAVGLTWEPLWSRIPWENDENLNNFGLFWSFLKSRCLTTLLSWAFVGDKNWAKSSQHSYAIGLTWEPLWSRIPCENCENLNNFGSFWSSSKSMHRATLLNWTFVGDMNWVMFPQHNILMLSVRPGNHFAMIYLEKTEWFRKKIWVRKNTNPRKNSKYHFTDLYFFWLLFVLFFRINFYFWTCIFSKAYFSRQ